jgi:hypothetical protein
MMSQVSGEGKVELKFFLVFEKCSPNGVPSLPFYSLREGPGVHEKEKEEKKKEKKQGRREPWGYATLILHRRSCWS